MDPFIGEIRMFAGNFAPRGYATCDGQLIAISQNTALFSLLGTSYGGNGQTNFALPNLGGRTPLGWGGGPGLSYRSLGESGGAETVTLLQSQVPTHSHVPMGVAAPGSSPTPVNQQWAEIRGQLYSDAAPTVPMYGQAVTAVGGNQPHDNLAPVVVLTFIIALQGIFPQRP